MKSVQGRREFLTRTALAGTAVVAFGAASSSVGAAGEIVAAAATAPTAESAALAFVRRYSPAAGFAPAGTANLGVTIEAPVQDAAKMAAALGRAHEAGIARIETAGNVARFTLAGRAVEVRHVWTAA